MSDNLPVEPPWYCVRTKRFSEHIAAENIVGQVGVETFCPFIRFEKVRLTGKMWVTEALFPNYIFVRPSDYAASFRHILSIRGVLRFVGFGLGEPLIVPQQVIAEIRQTVGKNNTIIVSQKINQGDEVTITSGALRGIEAIVSRVMPAKERVAILLDMLGSMQEVVVPMSQVIIRRDHPLA